MPPKRSTCVHIYMCTYACSKYSTLVCSILCAGVVDKSVLGSNSFPLFFYLTARNGELAVAVICNLMHDQSVCVCIFVCIQIFFAATI